MTGAHLADRVARALLPLALAAVVLALLVPSEKVAGRGDLVLAAPVALTALGIAPQALWDLRTRWAAVLGLSLVSFAALVPIAWMLSRLFESPSARECLPSACPPRRSPRSGSSPSPPATRPSRSARSPGR